MSNQLNTELKVRAAAKEFVQAQKEASNLSQDIFKSLFDQLDSTDLSKDSSLEIIATLLSLPDAQFEQLYPYFLEEIESAFNDVSTKMTFAQLCNVKGVTYEELVEQQDEMLKQISEATLLSAVKRDFLKRMTGFMFNSIVDSQHISRKVVSIPIELMDESARIPEYAHLTDAGMDIYANEDVTIAPGETKMVHTGLRVAIPKGYEIQIRPKSGRCLKTKLRLSNSVATIDSGYRGEICVLLDNIEPYIKQADIDESGRLYNVLFGSSCTISKGEKIAQMILSEVPHIKFEQVDSIEEFASDGRGTGGFGSSSIYAKEDSRYKTDV